LWAKQYAKPRHPQTVVFRAFLCYSSAPKPAILVWRLVYGHEVVHTLGRAHPSKGNGCGHSASDPNYPYAGSKISDLSGGSARFMGFDSGYAIQVNADIEFGPAVYNGTSWFDVIGYCVPQWISDYTFEGMYDFADTQAARAQTAALEIFNSGGGELSWSATSDAPWLTLSATSGNAPATITLSASPQGMINGTTRSATVRVTTTSGGGTQLVEVPVTLAAGRVWELGGSPPTVHLPIVSR
jgi:hypothetical protein